MHKEGYVQKEIRTALDRVYEKEKEDVFLIPVRLEPVEPPEPLRYYQWVDYFAEGGPERLILAIRAATERRLRKSN
jgi:hypothetical protein